MTLLNPDLVAAASQCTRRIYDMHHGAICTVSRKGVRYMNWLDAFCAGRLFIGEAW